MKIIELVTTLLPLLGALAMSSSQAKTVGDQVLDFGNDISAIPSTSPASDVPGLTLKLSFNELHTLGDYIVEVCLLACPTLNGTAARSMKAFMRDRVKSSMYKELHQAEYDGFNSKLNACHGALTQKRDEEWALAHPATTTTTTTEPPTTTTTTAKPETSTPTTSAPPPPATTKKPDSAWDKVSNWFSDMYTETTNFFGKILRRKRDLRDASRSSNSNANTVASSGAFKSKEQIEQFDHKLQAKQNFEEMVNAMTKIVKRVCVNISKYEAYINKVVEEFMYWIRNYEGPDIIYLSDSYFSTSNLLQLARKCTVA